MSEHLEFGWFIPTAGDSRCPGKPEQTIEPSLELFTRIARAAESAGFEYLLVPVQTLCYEAWVTCAMVAAQTEKIKMLVAIRPSTIEPTVLAKMFTTFDQLTKGRVCANLIAGGGAAELAADGCFLDHDERYEMMDECVTLMKRCWTESKDVAHEGKYFKVENARVRPRPYQDPHPPFYLGGISDAARDISAHHASTHLFWGDTPENIVPQIADLRERARAYGREDELKFGMRLQIIVRDTEEEAWRAADELIAGADEGLKRQIKNLWEQSEANTRMKKLGEVEGYRIAPHLWSGLTTIRPGAGVAVVGNPEQVAATLQEFVDIGCTGFCLSGYPHDEAAERFGRLVMPYFESQRVAAEVS